jgi:hypothetical protein
MVGCVSAGKSTISNTFLGEDYAECRRRRTTMMPSVFIESSDLSKIDEIKTIWDKIYDSNKRIYEQTNSSIATKSKPFNLDDYGNELIFYVENMQLNKKNKNKICLYDIPGLNDAKTKQVYYDYLKKNFHKFNIILFIVDIQSGLNTSDETDILNFLVEHIKLHKETSGKNIGMLSIVNKADDMQLNEQTEELEVLGELKEMLDQAKKTIWDAFKKENLEQNLIGCVPVCGLDANLYRGIKKYKNIEKISDENILRIGVNDIGSKFRGKNKVDQVSHVKKIIQDEKFVDSMIKLSGFSQVENCLNAFLQTKGNSMITENIMWEYFKIPAMNPVNMMECLGEKIMVLAKLYNYDRDLWNIEMGKLVKQLNTISFKTISEMKDPWKIKKYWNDEIIKKLSSNEIIKKNISKVLDLDKYPGFIIGRIKDLIVDEYSGKDWIPIEKLNYFILLEQLSELNTNTVEMLIDCLLKNTRGSNTFIFETYVDGDFIPIFEKIKNANNFLGLLRLLLMNIYSRISVPKLIIEKRLFLRKQKEICLSEYLLHIQMEKFPQSLYNYSVQQVYITGNNFPNDNYLTEIYYIAKCREANDLDNFHSHDSIIDFSILDKFLE